MENNQNIFCPRCNSTTFNTELVENTLSRKKTALILIFITFVLPILISVIFSENKFTGFLIGTLISVPITAIAGNIFRIVYKFKNKKYDTILICTKCGKQIRVKS